MLSKFEFHKIPNDIWRLLFDDLLITDLINLSYIDKGSNHYFKSNYLWNSFLERDFYSEYQSQNMASNKIDALKTYQRIYEAWLMFPGHANNVHYSDLRDKSFFYAKNNDYENITSIASNIKSVGPETGFEIVYKDMKGNKFNIFQIISKYSSQEIKDRIFSIYETKRGHHRGLLIDAIILGQDNKKITAIFEKLVKTVALPPFTSMTELIVNAAGHNNIGIVDYLLYCGFNIDSTIVHHSTSTHNYLDFYSPLHAACISGHTKLVAHLIAKGATIELKDQNQTTPLYQACKHGQSSTVELLLNKGAQFSEDLLSNGPCSEVVIIVKNGYKTCLEVVFNYLKAAANFNFDVFCLDPLLELAVTNNHPATTRVLCEHEAKITPSHLETAINRGNFELLMVLLEFGADLKSINNFSIEKAISEATVKGHFNMVKYYYPMLIDIHTIYIKEKTLLHSAVEAGRGQIVKFLLSKGANLELDKDNYLLHMACKTHFADIVKTLLGYKPGWIELLNSHNETPLLTAARSMYSGNFKAIEYLIKKGAQVNVSSIVTSSYTPLHYAAEKGDIAIIRLLLEYGANPLLINGQNKTPGALASNATVREILFESVLEWKKKSVFIVRLFGQKQDTSTNQEECNSLSLANLHMLK